MALTDHLREFRNRLGISVLAVVVGFVVAWVFYGQLLDLLTGPVIHVQEQLKEKQNTDTEIVINGVASSFLLQTKVSLVAGMVAASPVWLYELWAFIMPGLHRNERRWTIMFVSVGRAACSSPGCCSATTSCRRVCWS